MDNGLLFTNNLSVGYKHKAVIDGIEISVSPGMIVTIIGPNGGGKTTILRTLTRELLPICGAIYLDGRELSSFNNADIGRTMAILMTERPRTELMTCRDIVNAGRYPYTGRLGILSKDDRREVEHAMELVGVSGLADRDFRKISDGQKQLVMLARAICQKPGILLLDEPTSFLDLRHKLELLRVIKELVNREKLAVLMSLHELDLAQKVSDSIVCVKGGRIDRIGSPDDIFKGGYIESLFNVTSGHYIEPFGSPELKKACGRPEVFVIGGNGKGIPVYRALQRKGIPFAAGILHENDIDVPVAEALSAQVFIERAFEPISHESVQKAAEVLKACRNVICCLNEFGPMNEGNRQLLEIAENMGIPVEDKYGL